jgi:hypothetical protein
MGVVAYLEALNTLIRESRGWREWLDNHRTLLEPEEIEVLDNNLKEEENDKRSDN